MGIHTDDKRGLASRFFGREDVYAGLFFLVVFLRLSIHNLPPPFFGFFVWLNVPRFVRGGCMTEGYGTRSAQGLRAYRSIELEMGLVHMVFKQGIKQICFSTVVTDRL